MPFLGKFSFCRFSPFLLIFGLKINFFVYCSKLAHYIFLIFCMELKRIKWYKLLQMPFLGKFSFCRFSLFLLIFGPKINFFVYCSKLAHLIFLIFCMKLKGIKGYKLLQTPFLGKFSFCLFSKLYHKTFKMVSPS